MRRSKPTSTESAILNALRWGHITREQAAVKLGARAPALLG